jgi:putative spermidine/putrescine transport system substrate-binding protein
MHMWRGLSTIMAVLCSCALSSGARAEEPLVVSAYGGVWKESVEKNFGACYTQRTGNKIAIQTGESADWLNRIRANPKAPPIHVVTMAQADTMRAIKDDLIETIDPAKIPSLKDIPERFYKPWQGKAIDIHVGAFGVLYNKEKIANPPADWKTLIDDIIAGKYGKRVAWPSGTYSWGPDMIWFMGQLYGGNIDQAFAKLKAMAPYVVKFWTSPVEVLDSFGAKQVDLVMYWDGRAYAFIDKGNPWAAYYSPKPGALAATVAVAKVKNSPDSAWVYMDCALSADVQLGHAKTLRYAVTNSKVVYPDELKDKVAKLDELVLLPYPQEIDKFPGWVERWNKEMR